MKRCVVPVLAVLATIAGCLSALAAEVDIWATDSLVKLAAGAAPGVTKSVSLSAARNEFESFQVHVRPKSEAVVLTSVAVSDFVGEAGAKIGAADLVVYREAYLDIDRPSDLNGAIGRLPDPLVPARDPQLGEERLAFPVTVPAGTVQSVWVDVHVPPGATPGRYIATVKVTIGATQITRLRVSLLVRKFTLPSTASLRSAFEMSYLSLCLPVYGDYDRCSQYPGSDGNSERAIELIHVRTAELLLDHRISVSSVPSAGPPSVPWAKFDAVYGPLLRGTASTLLAGAKLTGLRYWAPGNRIAAADIRDWVEHASAGNWLDALFHYTCDEPPAGCAWDQLATDAAAVRAASSDMKTLVTTDLDQAAGHGLLQTISVLTPNLERVEPLDGTNQRTRYDAWLKRGKNRHIWWYQSCTQHGSCSNDVIGPRTSTWPSYMIDASPVRNRIFQWMAYSDRIEGELYFAIDYCWYTECGMVGVKDPWTSVLAYGGQGDGTLVYPGDHQIIGGTTPITLPSIRLKHIRDGMEDYEYLVALAKAGKAQRARAILARLITSATKFEDQPATLRRARAALADELDKTVQ